MKISRIVATTVAACLLAALLLAVTAIVAHPPTAHAATYLVTNTDNSGPGSLRQAIDDANSNPGEDTINFDIPGSGPHTISPTSFLPALTDKIIINGYSQPDAARATADTSATILIELDGSAAGSDVGGLYFFTDSDDSEVNGLSITNWNRDGIYILNPAGIKINGCYIGVDASGAVAKGNMDCGVIVEQSASTGVVIGGSSPGDRNVISGNIGNGIETVLQSDCLVQGNYIGTDANGAGAIGNTGHGIFIYGDPFASTGAQIDGNLISGNGENGIEIQIASHTTVTGNFIGTDVDGTSALPNKGHGVDVNSDDITIGGTTPAEGNVISGNDQQGINVDDSSGCVIKANLLGIDAGGAAAMPNSWSGICVSSKAENATIGGTTAGERNVISGNDIYGVDIQDSENVDVTGNYVGLNKNGNAAVGNGYAGIKIWKSSSDVNVGGQTAGETNVISANGWSGVDISDCSDVNVTCNYIGTDATGTFALGNYWGVSVAQGSDNLTIGGDDSGKRNVISGNKYGIYLNGCTGTATKGNFIGTNATVTTALGNTSAGIYLYQGADGNVVGGTAAGTGNVISGNGGYGIHVYQSAGNQVLGNCIGTGAGGSGPIGNGGTGLYVESGSDDTVVGGSGGGGNTIAYNVKDGVGIRGSVGCEVIGNHVASNQGIGVVVWDKGSYRDGISGNSIYGNSALGIDLGGDGVTPNDGNNNNPNKPNRGYNYPVITRCSFLAPGGNVLVAGTAPPNSNVEVYEVGSKTDPSGHGQGLTFLGAVDADIGGNFSTTFGGLDPGDGVSAIAISPAGDPSGEGNTSEFSADATAVTPRISGCDPTTVVQGHTLNVDITGSGTHFADGTSVATFSGPGITVNDTHVSDDNHAMASITVSPDATPGFRNLDVVTGAETPTPLSGVFQVLQAPPSPPHIDSLDPTSGSVGTHVTVAGQHFGDGMGSSSVSFNGTEAVQYDSWSDGQVVCRVPEGATTGPVTVSTPAGISNGVEFTVVVPPAPVIKDCEPTGVVQGHSIELDVLGQNTHFQEGISRATVSGAGVVITGTTVTDVTHAGAGLSVAAGAPPGTRDVNVVTGEETPAPLKNVFTVYPAPPSPPEIDSVQPAGGSPGTTVSLAGSNLGTVKGSSRVTFNGTPVTNYVSWSDFEVVLSVPCGASSGPIKVETPWGTSNGFAFEVTASTFYFAEGTCRPDFEPYLTVQNPGGEGAEVMVTYIKGNGTTQQQEITVPATTRSTISVKDVLGEGNDAAHDFSTRVECTNSQEVVVERPIYFDYHGIWTGGSDVIGATAPARTFYFAEGTCRPGFEPYLTILNPGQSEARVRITYMKGDGSTALQNLAVNPTTRSTIAVKDVLGEGDDPAHDFSCEVESTGTQQIVAERPMYFRYGIPQGLGWTGGSDVVGAASPAESFYFAEGTCRPGFQPYLTVQNPGRTEAEVLITYWLGDSGMRQQALTVPAATRSTVSVRDLLGVGDDPAHDFSCRVESLNNVDIVAERPMYFCYGTEKGLGWTGGSDVVGALAPAPAFYFAEGTCRPGFVPYLTIENPGLAQAEVRITYMLGDGSTREQAIGVGAHSRRTVSVIEVLGTGDDAAHDFSCTVESLNGREIVVERPMYFDYQGWTGGSDVVGFAP
ncbi:MAG: right-handed parallel beta-helix repeat-containing protein [Actinobacteria bacterium]|nr:right-handed parallel beta-helix repeat-containing protein [Actinomycetota bacterium]MBU1943257.1 right-handed parallel beta-helix repeat-containing protein [Actinomycetota bacterium]MBU2688994.1 right-handed parallel beta-helix repeat-containing protein [Actinomycetota bacterium]